MVFASFSTVRGQNLIDKSNKIELNKKGQVIYGPLRENLKLLYSDTVTKSKSYHFSNPKSAKTYFI